MRATATEIVRHWSSYLIKVKPGKRKTRGYARLSPPPSVLVSSDYALMEYGLTTEEVAAAEQRISSEIKAARQRREVKPFTGTADDFRFELAVSV